MADLRGGTRATIAHYRHRAPEALPDAASRRPSGPGQAQRRTGAGIEEAEVRAEAPWSLQSRRTGSPQRRPSSRDRNARRGPSPASSAASDCQRRRRASRRRCRCARAASRGRCWPACCRRVPPPCRNRTSMPRRLRHRACPTFPTASSRCAPSPRSAGRQHFDPRRGRRDTPPSMSSSPPLFMRMLPE